jgi:hypothetical protein
MAQDPRPGKYRSTMKSDMPGMAGKPMVDEDCISKKESDDGLTRLGIEKDTQCKVLDLKRTPGQVSYRLECVEDGRKSTVQANGKLAADAFDFTLVMTSAQMGPKPVTMNIQGKRIGDCK